MPLPFVSLGHAGPLYPPALRYPLDDPSGNFRDIGGQGLGWSPGVVNGTLARNPVAPPGVWLPGCVGFTGAGWINIWNHALQYMLSQYAFSIAFWVRRTAEITAANGMQQITAGGDWAWSCMVGHHASLPYSRGNAFSFGYTNVNGNWENSVDNADLPLNTWWHYVCTWDGYRQGIDRNGVDIVSNSGIPLPKAPTSAAIGTYPDGTSYRASALQVADLRFYPYRLYETESLALYQSYFNHPARPWVRSGEPGSLILWLPMDQPGSRNIRDANGNPAGGNTVGSSGAYFTNEPRTGMGYYAFNGTSERWAVKGTNALNNTTKNWTLAAWVYPTAARPSEPCCIITKTLSGSIPFALSYGGTAGNPITPAATNRVGVASYDGTWSGVADPNVLPLNTWTHVAGSYDGTTFRLYRDGIQVATATASRNPGAQAADVQIGARWDSLGLASSFFPGRMSDVRIYNETLTPESIKAIYDRASAIQRPWMPVGVVT